MNTQIIGANGFTGGELIRILLNHPEVELMQPYSRSCSGKKVYEVHYDLFGQTELYYTNQLNPDADIYFFCLPHGESQVFFQNYIIPDEKIVIDLGSDFRYSEHPDRDFVYGLPELNRNAIRTSNSIANPGCFATAIQLSLLPLASRGFFKGEINVTATTGATGAGSALNDKTHFSWRQNNQSMYKIFSHQHLREINSTLRFIYPDFSSDINFIPQRGSFTRGIISCCWLNSKMELNELNKIYKEFFKDHAFTHIVPFDADLKMVINTNNCFLQLVKEGDRLGVISVIDNLLKGAAGQAVQNMNIALGLEETTGLQLKASVY